MAGDLQQEGLPEVAVDGDDVCLGGPAARDEAPDAEAARAPFEGKFYETVEQRLTQLFAEVDDEGAAADTACSGASVGPVARLQPRRAPLDRLPSRGPGTVSRSSTHRA